MPRNNQRLEVWPLRSPFESFHGKSFLRGRPGTNNNKYDNGLHWVVNWIIQAGLRLGTEEKEGDYIVTSPRVSLWSILLAHWSRHHCTYFRLRALRLMMTKAEPLHKHTASLVPVGSSRNKPFAVKINSGIRRISRQKRRQQQQKKKKHWIWRMRTVIGESLFIHLLILLRFEDSRWWETRQPTRTTEPGREDWGG